MAEHRHDLLLERLLDQALLQAASARMVYLRVRCKGRHRRSAWLRTDRLHAWLSACLAQVLSDQGMTLEMSLLDDTAIALEANPWLLSDRERGLWGFELSDPQGPLRLAPNDIVTGNRRHGKALAGMLGTQAGDFARVFAYPTRQWLLAHSPSPRWIPLKRQKAPAGSRPADDPGIAGMREGLAGWLYAQADADGGLPYKYWPGNGRYSRADNSIRRLLGIWAMCQHARRHGDSRKRAQARLCLQRFLDEHYLLEQGCGLIEDPRGVKLGAIAVAGLALLAAPGRVAEQALSALHRATLRLQRSDGAFRTFWWPEARGDDNQNFYPGEALLLWAHLYRRNPGRRLRFAIDRSLAWYQRWHRDHPNPAFVPWHTFTCTTMYDITGNRGYLDSVSAMADFLIPLQQWRDAPHEDMRGRFHAPSRPDFGPPHASSTAVYSEAMIAAAQALNRAGAGAQARRCAAVAQRGLSHLRQLQYLDVTDLFRFAHPRRVAGGLRTEVYDLTLRIDSVAHALHACIAWEQAGMARLLPEVDRTVDHRQSPR